MPDPTNLTAEQCRAARALLGWSRSHLSEQSRVANSTLADFESGKREPHMRTLGDIRRTLEDAGAVFQAADSEIGPGVHLRKRG